ncbi:MAG: chromosome segregation protein SMC [Frankiaceae bacterium]
MHLKSLTLRGFKSFASSTTLRFEPGITAVVGPNGSGKSNVVDAIAWVLGEQGAKALRGGKMEDVIFAGTAGRPPLGRAEVILTIDNADGALPIDYTEVTISRIMFRGGGSEYAINGNPCRLLDVQELLSDSGIGRELHVIIGQGQLDEVLQAGPEDRRGFIEEAAGVLKHRKRKEKALRKLEAMQVNLNRLTDLTTELRRQLGPLGRQAEVARKAAKVQADARDARLRLLADDLVGLRAALEAEVADETAVRQRRAAVEEQLAAAAAKEQALEQVMATEAPRVARAQETWYRLSSLRERLRGTASLAAERLRHTAVDEEEAAPHGRDPDELEAEAALVREDETALAAELDGHRDALSGVVARRGELERALAAEELAVVAAVRAVADRREGLARLTGQVGALRSRAAAADAEIGRLSGALDEAVGRAERAAADLAELESTVAGMDEGEVGLDAAHERAVARLAEADASVEALRAQEREAERERTAHAARRDALALSLARRDGAGALLGASDRLGDGVLGPVAEVLAVRPGAEAAVAAALGAVADAVAVASVAAASDALALLKADDAGRAGLLVGGAIGAPYDDRAGWPALPPGARWAVDLVEAPPALVPSVQRLLARVAVVEDLAAARALVQGAPGARAVTMDGDLLGADWAVGGSASAPSAIEVRAAHDEAERLLGEATHRGERLRFALAGALEARTAAVAAVDEALGRLNESDARLAAVTERLGQLAAAARAAAEEADRLRSARASAEQARDRDLAGLGELEARLAAAQEAPADDEVSTDERDRLARACADERAAEMEARLAVRTAEERVAALAGRAAELLRSAAAERAARERVILQRARRAREAAVATAVLTGTGAALRRIEESLAAAAREREQAESARTVREGELLAVRATTRELAAELESLTSAVHRDEVARAEQRLRIEQLEARALEDLGVPPDVLVAEYGPDRLVPPVPGPDGAGADDEPVPYDRAAQEKRLAAAERALALLGRVNPLALEEFTALEERHQFLQTQLEDLKATRRDLLTVIRDVDERIHEVFTSAFEDTAREFEQVFSTLFPGGSGRLVLTEPSDMLATGIEIEARPPGKKVKRLSLLSGGERSLTAVAFLCAIFRARPSPFYVLDEVEAALDDRNLGRLLDLLSELRSISQLIVVTHQKRTMEIADALYGVSMRSDGITAVISQRLREQEPA